MKTIEVAKGQLLQMKDSLNTKVYYVKTGLLRSYSIDDRGKEHIFMFAPENWIIGDNVPGTQPAHLFIDAIEDSVIVQRDKNDELEHDVNKLIKCISVLQSRIIILMSASAIERYEHFITTYPDIVQRVPQKMIASYLGITPEALSMVKRTRLQKKE